MPKKTNRKKSVQYDRWGYFFIAPFFIVYLIFSLIPLLTTFYYSFFEYYRSGLEEIGPNARVYKYFSGREDFYKDELVDLGYALDELSDEYDARDVTTAELADKINSAVFAIDADYENIDAEKYTQKIAKLVSDGVKSKTPAVKVIEKAKSEVTAKQAALIHNIKLVFASTDNLGKYFWNTLVMWLAGFIPQILISLLLAIWFTNTELRLKGQRFFKSVIYMPNLIMAAAFSMLFFALFADQGPVNSIVLSIARKSGSANPEPIRFFSSTGWSRTLVAIMNFLMWYGNTTILLMAGVMGIDESLFEAARIDGANPIQIFFKVTIPLLLPIFVYVLITSLIGGIQMFDVPQILTNGGGSPDRTTMTIIMKLNKHLANKNYGPAGVMSVLIFIVTGVLSGVVYKSTMSQYQNKR